MSIRHSLLALLEQGPLYGYGLKSEFEATTGQMWPLNDGQVYTTATERDAWWRPRPSRTASGCTGAARGGPSWRRGSRRRSAAMPCPAMICHQLIFACARRGDVHRGSSGGRQPWVPPDLTRLKPTPRDECLDLP